MCQHQSTKWTMKTNIVSYYVYISFTYKLIKQERQSDFQKDIINILNILKKFFFI